MYWQTFNYNFLAKKSSWRAVVVMRWPEVIYQEANKSRLTDHFNKIPEEREKEATYNRFADWGKTHLRLVYFNNILMVIIF